MLETGLPFRLISYWNRLLSSAAMMDAKVQLQDVRQLPVAKREGFYVFSDIAAGNYTVGIRSHRSRPFVHSFSVPLPTQDRLVLRVPGENELILAVRIVDEEAKTISFAPQDLRDAIPAGAPIISSKGATSLAGRGIPDGEGIGTATLKHVAWGSAHLGPGDLVRVLRESVVRLRPGPLYPFEPILKRVTGTVRDALTGIPIGSATVRLTHISEGEDVFSLAHEDVGTTSVNRVRVYTIGDDAEKRVVGTEHTVSCTASSRGRYAFCFPERPDLRVDTVTLRAEAPGYSAGDSVEVDLTTNPQAERALELTPS